MDLVRRKFDVTREVERYSIVFRDHFPQYCWRNVVASKQDTPRTLEYVLAVTRLEGDSKIMRSKNRSESKHFYSWILGLHRIELEYIPVGVKGLNSVVERAILMLSATQ